MVQSKNRVKTTVHASAEAVEYVRDNVQQAGHYCKINPATHKPTLQQRPIHCTPWQLSHGYLVKKSITLKSRSHFSYLILTFLLFHSSIPKHTLAVLYLPHMWWCNIPQLLCEAHHTINQSLPHMKGAYFIRRLYDVYILASGAIC